MLRSTGVTTSRHRFSRVSCCQSPTVAITGTWGLKIFLFNFEMYRLDSVVPSKIVIYSTQVTADKTDLSGINQYAITF